MSWIRQKRASPSWWSGAACDSVFTSRRPTVALNAERPWLSYSIPQSPPATGRGSGPGRPCDFRRARSGGTDDSDGHQRPSLAAGGPPEKSSSRKMDRPTLRLTDQPLGGTVSDRRSTDTHEVGFSNCGVGERSAVAD